MCEGVPAGGVVTVLDIADQGPGAAAAPAAAASGFAPFLKVLITVLAAVSMPPHLSPARSRLPAAARARLRRRNRSRRDMAGQRLPPR
jgi:hypothetical protein